MKKTLLTFILAVVASVFASAETVTWDLQGTTYTVDTLFHNAMGPGTTTTSLWFRNAATQDALRVFYCTMDMTNPYLSLHGVCATDKLAGNEKISSMAIRKSEPGKRYFVGVNADFFTTSGTTNRGVSKVGSPVGSTVVDGEIYRARNNATLYKNFIVDKQGKVYTDPFWFGGTVVAPDGTSATLGGINVSATESAASNRNKVTIYNDKYYGGTAETGAGCEIAAVLAEGEKFETAKSFKMVLVSDTSTLGDMDIADGGYVLHGHGTAATFISGLHKGDTVVVTPSWTYNGVSVEPEQIVSGNPKILENGVTLQSEGDRGDANSRQPRAAIGYSDDGKKVYFFVVDGRSPISSGVRTTWLADIMRYAGVTDGINVDGGGSAILYTSTLGIRNKPSDGSERADGNGFYCVSSAPDDDVVASIRFVDYALKSPKYGIYTPKFYGYNQYGMLVNTDVKGVTLSCDEALGHVLEGDTTFYADGNVKEGLLTAHYNGITFSAPVQIVDAVDQINITNDSIITDSYKEYSVAVQTLVGETNMNISPLAMKWKSTDESIVTIGENTGVLKGVKNGTAYVIGTLGEVCDTMMVKVQVPTAHVMPIDPGLDISTWKITQTGGTNVVATANGNGIDYTYTGASGRAPKIVLTKSFELWSLPDTLRLRLNPGQAPVKNVVFGVRANGESMAYQTLTPEITPDQEMVIDLPTASWMDPTDMGNFPIVLSSIQLNMNTSTTGTEYNMHFNGFETVYNCIEPETAKTGDVNGDGKIDTSDITSLINKILGMADWTNCDVNADGKVDTSDITALISIILG